MQNLDSVASFVRSTMVKCDRIRRMLKLGADNMSPEQQQVAADMMDLHVARPVTEGMTSSYRNNNRPSSGEERSVPARYCYVKLIQPDPNVNERYYTYFWTMDGKPLKFDAVVGFRNFQVQPFVEMEEVFVSKAVTREQSPGRVWVFPVSAVPATEAQGVFGRPSGGTHATAVQCLFSRSFVYGGQ